MITRLHYNEDERVRIISDLHLGHKKAYFHNIPEVKFLLDGCDTLICLGDTAEARSGRYQEKGLALRQEFRDLCTAENKKLVLVGGNHDPDIHDRAAFLDDERIFMMHGDAMFRTGAPWGREFLYNKDLVFDIIRKYREGENLRDRLAMNQEIAGSIPAYVAREFGTNKIFNYLLHAAWPPDRPFRIMGAWMLYRKYIRRFVRKYTPQSEIIITGHLHKRSLFQADKRCFINTGAFFQNAIPWIIDIHRSKLTISNLEDRKKVGRSVASFFIK